MASSDSPMPDAAPEPSEVADRFFALATLLRQRANRGMHQQGFTMARGKLLSILEHRGPTRISALAAKLGISGVSVTEAVDALERDGYVQRGPDSTDRRAVLVSLTERGHTVIAGNDSSRAQVAEDIFGVLTPEQRSQFSTLLNLLHQAEK